jgi:type I restriction enzyme, S subunit
VIPKGWSITQLNQIGNVICGKTPATSNKEFYGYDVPFITIPDMHGNVFATRTARKLSSVGAQSQRNKMLPAGSLCVSCIATAGLVVITAEESQTNQQINSLIPNKVKQTYFWYWVLKNLGNEIAASGSGGSVLTNLSKGSFETFKVLKPLDCVTQQYNEFVTPIFRAILSKTRESEILSRKRNALLPKLLSAEFSATISHHVRPELAAT